MSDSASMQNIVVPAEAFVPCPARGFSNISVSRRCTGCEWFRGFTEVQSAGAFDARYRVNCEHVVARRMMLVET